MSLLSREAPQIAIIGRPNVGKSTLFNLITRTRKAMVKDEPGVTRDIIIEPAEWWGHKFDIIDTGGITEAQDQFSQMIREQVVSMLKEFDLLVCVMDAKTGLVPEDRDIIRLAKESGKPFVIAVNKVDREVNREVLLSEFYEFGFDIIPCAFEKSSGVDELVEWVIKNLPKIDNTQRQGIKLAIVGKPNAGKSSLCNQLLGQTRMHVSDIAGTTIDSVESQFEYGDETYKIIDTAGLRRQSRRKDGLEKLSAMKSLKTVERANIVLLVVDGTQGVTDQDARVLDHCLEQHKAVIVVANKSDLGKENIPEFRKTFRANLERTFHFFTQIPIVFTCANTGAGVKDLMEEVESVWQKLNFRVKTSKLNDFFYSTIRKAPSPVYGTQNVKFYYLTQTHQSPPSFIAFANHPEGVTRSYRRFLSKQIQQQYDLKEIPVRVFIMGSSR